MNSCVLLLLFCTLLWECGFCGILFPCMSSWDVDDGIRMYFVVEATPSIKDHLNEQLFGPMGSLSKTYKASSLDVPSWTSFAYFHNWDLSRWNSLEEEDEGCYRTLWRDANDSEVFDSVGASVVFSERGQGYGAVLSAIHIAAIDLNQRSAGEDVDVVSELISPVIIVITNKLPNVSVDSADLLPPPPDFEPYKCGKYGYPNLSQIDAAMLRSDAKLIVIVPPELVSFYRFYFSALTTTVSVQSIGETRDESVNSLVNGLRHVYCGVDDISVSLSAFAFINIEKDSEDDRRGNSVVNASSDPLQPNVY